MATIRPAAATQIGQTGCPGEVGASLMPLAKATIAEAAAAITTTTITPAIHMYPPAPWLGPLADRWRIVRHAEIGVDVVGLDELRLVGQAAAACLAAPVGALAGALEVAHPALSKVAMKSYAGSPASWTTEVAE
jgi:hypothetical protein